MNLLDLTKLVRRYLSEAGSARFEDPTIQAQLNRSARTLAEEMNLFRGVTTLDVVNGSVAVPADLLSIISVTHTGQRYDLTPVDATVAASDPAVYGYGLPRSYSFDEAWGRTLRVYPAQSATVRVVYRRAPDAMTTSTDEAWGGAHADHHDLIALHAAHRLYGGNGAGAARDPVWFQRFQQEREEFKDRLALQALDAPPMQLRPPRRPRR